MGQNPQRPQGTRTTTRTPTKIEPHLHSSIIVNQPMVRTFSTGGGHGPEKTLVEGDEKIVTKKWQGYPPENLKVVGKPLPPMPEVAIPRYTGKAEYATRVWFPNLLYAKLLTSPHPRARIKSLDTSNAERMPGVAYVLTYKNALGSAPMPQNLNFQGEVVAIVAADTEDLAEDAVAAIDVEYEVLPFASTLAQVMAPDAPDLRQGKGNLILQPPDNPQSDPKATLVAQHGDVEKGFAEADVIKEFTYTFAGAVPVPIQPCGSVAKWDGDKVTVWGMGQGIYPSRNAIARGLGIEPAKVRFINKWNGGTFGGARPGSERFYPHIAHIAKMTGRPTKIMLPKDQELAHLQVKPEVLTTFRVGARKDGRIIALVHDVYINNGNLEGGGIATAESAKNQTMLYTSGVPHWKSTWYSYKTNAIRTGSSRSNTQQEVKWAWENMIDEMAEAVGLDPIRFRMLHISKPGTKLSPARDWDAGELGTKYELENGALTYDSYASVEVLEEGAKAIGWDKRNAKPGGYPGRFKKGIGVAMSQHHAGHVGYHDGEVYFEKLTSSAERSGNEGGLYTAEVEVGAGGYVTMKNALPDSGTNHSSAMAALVAEMLGFTTRDWMRVVWGDSELTPPSIQWYGGLTTMLQGGAVCSATEKIRKDLLERAAVILKVDPATLQMRDGVISSTADPKKKTTFAELVQANKGPIRQLGRCASKDHGRALVKGIGACFVEVEVDTWTGDWRFLRSAYSHDAGLVINPLVAEGDMEGSLVQSTQMTTDAIPWDREFPGTRHYSVGYLSYRLPTIKDVPEQTQVFINSLEPRWFFGTKSFAETSIGAVPGAIANGIYNACGVRIREHPITREKIMAGLKANRGGA
jgi:CO/xanthine dehydrogenase Mo-binding subunit